MFLILTVSYVDNIPFFVFLATMLSIIYSLIIKLVQLTYDWGGVVLFWYFSGKDGFVSLMCHTINNQIFLFNLT